MNPGGSPQSVGSNDHRGESEVWIEKFRAHAYIRIGKTRNLGTLNEPKYAECVRAALQAEIDKERASSANAGHFSGEK